MFKRLVLLAVFVLLFSGCAMPPPTQKPEIGPAGEPPQSKPNPPIIQRFVPAPEQLYDLEATAGLIFDGINKENWSQAERGLNDLQNSWEQLKPVIGEKKGVQEADQALLKLIANVKDKRITASYETLNKFMSSVSDIAKSYKLSPLSDLITIGNAVRNVSFYVEDNNWTKAASKAKELENTWGATKTSLESVGILNEITKSHSSIKQIKDAVNAENKGSFDENLAKLNESLGRIRQYYRGK